MNIDCYNHYPAPIDFEPNVIKKQLKKVLKRLETDNAILTGAHLHNLDTLEFNLIDDETIAHLHDEYMSDPSPTDVITFHHGEVFVSYDTAIKEANARGIHLSEEILRYHIHGLLHLAGYDDLNPEDYDQMHELQEQLVELIK